MSMTRRGREGKKLLGVFGPFWALGGLSGPQDPFQIPSYGKLCRIHRSEVILVLLASSSCRFYTLAGGLLLTCVFLDPYGEPGQASVSQSFSEPPKRGGGMAGGGAPKAPRPALAPLGSSESSGRRWLGQVPHRGPKKHMSEKSVQSNGLGETAHPDR